MNLRDYQRRTVIDVLSQPRSNPCIVAPTGSGKTVIGAAVIDAFADRYGFCKATWVTHRHELLEQAMETCGNITHPHRAEVQFHTIQSIRGTLGTSSDLLILDECHHYTAADWSFVLQRVPHDMRIGLTATPERADGKGLHTALDRIITAASYSELIERGLLVRCHIWAGNDHNELSRMPSHAWDSYARGLKTIAFAPSVDLAQSWTSAFNARGTPAACITGEMDKDLRAYKIAAFKAGEIQVLWNVYVLTEGFDVPNVECIMLARRFNHAGQYLQATGRGIRPAPGKDKLLLLDLANNWELHGVPTEDRKYSLEGKAIRRMKVQKLRQCATCGSVCKAWIGQCPECGYVAPKRDIKIRIGTAELEEVFDGENTPGDAKFNELSRLRSLQIERGYNIRWVVKEYKKLFGRNPVIRDATDNEIHDHYASLINARRWPSWLCKKMTVSLFGRGP